jgi:uncharacterized protein (DUF427 family)
MAIRFPSAIPESSQELRYEPRPQRIRVNLDGEPVADTSDAMLVWEPRNVVPMYAVPWHDFEATLERGDRVEPDLASLPPVLGPDQFAAHTTAGDPVVVEAAGQRLEGVAFAPSDPDLGGRVILWFAPFEWIEEEEPVIGHPHDPFKRVDVLASSRRVEVSLDGQVLADSTSSLMLLETYLPPRWYLPRSDVRMDLMTPSDKDTICAYKGHASYFSFEPAGKRGEDIAWTYVDPLHDALRVEGMVCFFSERSDLRLDGEPQERPRTFWS